ncbi:MAG: phosphoribosyltransferase family protein [Candidatus Paceibacterota bacterium]
MNFKEISFPGEETKYIFVDEKKLTALTRQLAQKILAEESRIDYLVAMAKGGWTVARSLFGYLQPTGLKDTVTVGVGSYDGIGQEGQVRMYQKLSKKLEERLKGKKVLVVDDLTESGNQLTAVQNYLESLGVERVILAALFLKPDSKANLDYWADTTSAWIIFAYEAFETMQELDENWQMKNIEEAEIKNRFNEIGFDQEDIDFYWQYRQVLVKPSA